MIKKQDLYLRGKPGARRLAFGIAVGLTLVACGTNTAVPATAPANEGLPVTTPLAPGTNTAVPAHTPSPLPPATTAAPTTTPSATPSPSPTQTPTPSATPLPLLNGLALDDILLMDAATQENVRQIYSKGQQWGRDPHRFSVLGDSTVMTPHLMARFDGHDLNLGPYRYLQPVVDRFAGAWSRFGVATNYGLHSWSVFDPLWADKKWCEPNEDLLSCEFRLYNPAFLLIRLGSNDAGSPSGFEYNVRQVIEHTSDHGIVPIIITKPDRFEGDNTNNEILRQLAATYHVPIWDLDRVAQTLPGKGLDEDQVHMVEYTANDFADPAAFSSGHAMQDLSGLMALYAIVQTVQTAAE